MPKEKEDLVFLIRGKSYSYSGYPDKRPKDLLTLFIKMKLPEDALLEAFRKNCPDEAVTLGDEGIWTQYRAAVAAKAKKSGDTAPAPAPPVAKGPTPSAPPSEVLAPPAQAQPAPTRAPPQPTAQPKVQSTPAASSTTDPRGRSNSHDDRRIKEIRDAIAAMPPAPAPTSPLPRDVSPSRPTDAVASQFIAPNASVTSAISTQEREDVSMFIKKVLAGGGGQGSDALPGDLAGLGLGGLANQSVTTMGTMSMANSTTVLSTERSTAQLGGSLSPRTGSVPVGDGVKIFLCLEGSDTQKVVNVPRTITFDDMAGLVERKFQRPMLLSFIDDGDRIEIDDDDGLQMFFEQDTKKLKMVCTDPSTARTTESFVGPGAGAGAIPGLHRNSSGGVQMTSLGGYHFPAGSGPSVAGSSQGRAQSFVTAGTLESLDGSVNLGGSGGGNASSTLRGGPIPDAAGGGGDRNKPIKELKQFTGHAEAVYCCSFNPAGDRFVTSSKDKSVRVWNVNDMSDVKLMKGGHTGFVLTCDFSPDGTKIVSGSDDSTLKIWNASTGQKLHSLKGHSDKVYACMWAPSGTHVVSASCDRTLRVWNAEKGKVEVTLKGHGLAVFTCAFSQTDSGQHVVSGSDDKLIKIWKWKDSKDSRTLVGHSGTVWSVRFSNDDRWVCSSSMDHEIKLWDATMGQQIRSYTGHLTPIHQAMFSPDNKYIISCARDWTIMVWEVETGRSVDTLAGHRNTVYHIDVRKDMVISCSLDNTVRLWRFDHK